MTEPTTEIEQIRARYAPTSQLALRIADLPIRLESNEPAALAAARAYFCPYVVDAGPADAPTLYLFQGEAVYDPARLAIVTRGGLNRPPKEALYDTSGARVILKQRTGLTIYVTDTAQYVVGDLLTHFNQVVNAVNVVFMKGKIAQGFVMFHASAAQRPGPVDQARGLAFASLSGAGKSSVAMHLIARGYQYVTNDRLLLRLGATGVEMLGVPKWPRVNPGTLLTVPELASLLTPNERERYRALPPDELWSLEAKHDVIVPDVFGPAAFDLAGRLAAVYLLNWRRTTPGFQVQPIQPTEAAEALRSLLKTVGVYDRAAAAAASPEPTIERLASAIPYYSVTGYAYPARLAAYITSPDEARG
jgi:HprK-related kinase B